ncbi:MAG: hypothetical protein AB7O45_05550 [Alphaproteobacteria bacterium]
MAESKESNEQRAVARSLEMVPKLPGFDDDALGVLHGNAERLQKVGSVSQRAAAAAILPAIRAEIAARLAAKPAPVKVARRAGVKKPVAPPRD